jgi:hypothetical protein
MSSQVAAVLTLAQTAKAGHAALRRAVRTTDPNANRRAGAWAIAEPPPDARTMTTYRLVSTAASPPSRPRRHERLPRPRRRADAPDDRRGQSRHASEKADHKPAVLAFNPATLAAVAAVVDAIYGYHGALHRDAAWRLLSQPKTIHDVFGLHVQADPQIDAGAFVVRGDRAAAGASLAA